MCRQYKCTCFSGQVAPYTVGKKPFIDSMLIHPSSYLCVPPSSSPVQPLTHLSPVSAVQPLLSPKPVRYGNHTNLLYPSVLISVKSAAPFPVFYGCRRELLLNPLEFLPRGGPCPPALTPSAPTLAIRSHSTVIGLQAR